jgi:hypothetical protein
MKIGARDIIIFLRFEQPFDYFEFERVTRPHTGRGPRRDVMQPSSSPSPDDGVAQSAAMTIGRRPPVAVRAWDRFKPRLSFFPSSLLQGGGKTKRQPRHCSGSALTKGRS